MGDSSPKKLNRLFLNNTEVKNRKSYSPSSDLELDTCRFNIFKVHTFGLTSRSLSVAQSIY